MALGRFIIRTILRYRCQPVFLSVYNKRRYLATVDFLGNDSFGDSFPIVFVKGCKYRDPSVFVRDYTDQYETELPVRYILHFHFIYSALRNHVHLHNYNMRLQS